MKPWRGVRERTEELERASLSSWATLAAETKGRDRLEELDDLRTVFQQDRDRIVSCDAFRRLRGKSKLLLPGPVSAALDRVRLDDALDVAEVARTVARGLRLNEDLVEAIVLGRDLGHPPFGNVGEEALAVFTDAGFSHSEQSLRIVERLEGGGQGLNLTWEVRDGILNHAAAMPMPATLEGQVVRVVGGIAALSGDLQTVVRIGLVDDRDVPAEVRAGLGATHGARMSTLVEDVVETTYDRPEVAAGTRIAAAAQVLALFLEERVHRTPAIAEERDRASHCLRSLAIFHLENPWRDSATGTSGFAAVLDHLAGLTDRAARREFTQRFAPASGS